MKTLPIPQDRAPSATHADVKALLDYGPQNSFGDLLAALVSRTEGTFGGTFCPWLVSLGGERPASRARIQFVPLWLLVQCVAQRSSQIGGLRDCDG